MMEHGKKRCIIVGAGEWTPQKIETDKDDLVIAVDGGFSYCVRMGLEPDVLIGDFDSVSGDDREKLEAIKEQEPDRVVALCPVKDDTDMLAALKLGLKRGYRSFWIYGATGGRLEHTIANIQCLLFLKKEGAEGYLLDGREKIFVLKNEEVHFPPEAEGYLSLFCLGEEAKGVDIRGMKYPLENYTMRNDYPIGISNEFTGCEGIVRVRDGELVGILSRKDIQD